MSLSEMLENADIDLLDIVVDEAAHFTVAKEALERGLDVIVEKPFVLNYSHALELKRLAEQKNANIFVGHILRFDSRMKYLKDQIDSGAIGNIRYMSFKRNFQPSAHNVYGRVNPFYSGMIHDIDLSIWFLKHKPTEFYSSVSYLLKRPTPDVLVAMLGFPNGVRSRLENIWHVSRTCPYGFENEIDVYGSKSTIRVSNTPVVEIWGENKMEVPDMFFWPYIAGKRVGALHDMLEHYLECAKNKVGSPVLPIDDIVETIRIAETLEKNSIKAK